MKRSRKKLDMNKMVKIEGEQARKSRIQSGGTISSCSNVSGAENSSPISSTKKIQVLETVTINKALNKCNNLRSENSAQSSSAGKYCAQKPILNDSNSVFISPLTKKEFRILGQPSDDIKKVDSDSISLDNISMSNLIPPFESTLNSELMNELLSTPRTKNSRKSFSLLNTPTGNTDGDMQVHKTPISSSKRKSVLITEYNEVDSDNASEFSPKSSKHLKLKSGYIDYDFKQYAGNEDSPTGNHDIENILIHHKISNTDYELSDDEQIFDLTPKRTQVKADKGRTQSNPSILEQEIIADIESRIEHPDFAVPENRENYKMQPSLEVNVNIVPCSSDLSSIEDSSSNLENGSDSDTFDEIYDTESESNTSCIEIEDNDIEIEEQWADISDRGPINFAQYSLKSEVNVSPNIQLNEPIDYYKLFVTNEVIEKMVEKTNDYATEYLNSHSIKPKSRLQNWVPTTVEEMERFLGVLMVMGTNKVPNINLYWSKKKCYRNEYIVQAMPRDRFLLLLKFWHFSDNVDNGDKLYKIRNVLDILMEAFSRMMKPGRFMVIDETMIAWKGRLKFRQYIKNKAHKYGIKLYKLCTPEGYTYSMILYTGKDEEKSGSAGHAQDVVLKLIKKLVGEGRTLVADNFYTSVPLAEELLKKKTFICGTIRTNRKGLPKTIISTKLKKGEVIGSMNKKGVKIIKWMDKRPVTMITTVKEHNATLKDTGKLSRVSKEPIMKPASVLMYNENKKGVDFSDQMTAYYSTLLRGLKWYRKVMMSLIFGTCLVNAWLVHKFKNVEQLTLISFLEAIIQSLTKILFTDSNNNEKKNRICHTLKKAEKYKKCHYCYKELRKELTSRETDKKVKRVRTVCQECQKPMCLECYNKVHTSTN